MWFKVSLMALPTTDDVRITEDVKRVCAWATSPDDPKLPPPSLGVSGAKEAQAQTLSCCSDRAYFQVEERRDFLKIIIIIKIGAEKENRGRVQRCISRYCRHCCRAQSTLVVVGKRCRSGWSRALHPCLLPPTNVPDSSAFNLSRRTGALIDESVFGSCWRCSRPCNTE